MKRKIIVLSQLVLIFFLIVSVVGSAILIPIIQNLPNSELETKVGADWTYMVYLDADNNLDSYGVDDINEMEDGYNDAAASDVNVIVFIDREHSGAKTYQISHDNAPGVVTSTILTTGFPSEPNMGSKITLKAFIAYCFNNFPADKYVLDLWDHGGGIFGICWDDSSGNDKLSFDEVDEAIEEACIAAGETIDILGLDACLMAMLEIDYEMREYVDIIVASEETIPGDGFPYNTMIASLCSNPSWTPTQYADDMVGDYYASYPSGDITLSAVDVTPASINPLMDAFNNFTAELRDLISYGYKNDLAAARIASQEFYYDVFIDLYDFAREAQSKNLDPSGFFDTSCQDLMDNISAAVIRSEQRNNPDAEGIAIYFPRTKGDYDSGYETVIDLGQETDWDQFLKEYYDGPSFSLSLLSYRYNDSLAVAAWNDADDIVDPGETINASIAVKNTGSIDATSINGTLTTSDPNITMIVGFRDYGDLTKGTSLTLDFRFNVSQTAVTGQVIIFTFVINGTFAKNYAKTETLYLIVNVSTIYGGDSFANAVEVTEGIFNSIMPGLDPTDLSAWFKIKVNGSMFLITSILSAGSGTDYDIYVYHPSGYILTAAALASYPDTCSTIAPITGYYRLRVHPYAGSGVYAINVTISNTTGPEDGNAWGSAISFWPNQTSFTGSCPNVNSATGYMYYRVFLANLQTIRVTLTGNSAQHDFDLYILDGTFQAVANSLSAQYPEKITYTAQQEGYVYILVVPYSGSGEYTVTVEYLDITPWPEWLIYLVIVGIAAAVIGGIYLFFKVSQ